MRSRLSILIVLLAGVPATAQESKPPAGFAPLFDGKTLSTAGTGWTRSTLGSLARMPEAERPPEARRPGPNDDPGNTGRPRAESWSTTAKERLPDDRQGVRRRRNPGRLQDRRPGRQRGLPPGRSRRSRSGTSTEGGRQVQRSGRTRARAAFGTTRRGCGGQGPDRPGRQAVRRVEPAPDLPGRAPGRRSTSTTGSWSITRSWRTTTTARRRSWPGGRSSSRPTAARSDGGTSYVREVPSQGGERSSSPRRPVARASPRSSTARPSKAGPGRSSKYEVVEGAIRCKPGTGGTIWYDKDYSRTSSGPGRVQAPPRRQQRPRHPLPGPGRRQPTPG